VQRLRAAQQPLGNVVRTTVQAQAAVHGGTQSLHTNAYDEALALPTEASAQLALRTQQILAHESGVADFVDPLAGSYAVEALTSEIEARARELIARIDQMGGMVAAIEQRFPQREIERRAYEHQRAVESKERIIVGQNAFVVDEPAPSGIHKLDPALEREQAERVRALRGRRDQAACDTLLGELERAARTGENLLPRILGCVRALGTVGEIADALRKVFGEHQERP
jgi:methylmalonyl-CoA mutase N-terminal domain/subunit